MRSGKLTLPYLIALGVDSTVGVGIFFTAGSLANTAGRTSVGLFLFCGLLLSLVALVYARLGRMTSRNGGPYIYASLAFGKKRAYSLGWMDWLGAAIGLGGITGMLAATVGTAAASVWIGKSVGVLILLTLGYLNYLGLSTGANTMAILTLLKLVPLLAICFGGLLSPAPLSAPAGSLESWPSLLLLVLFTCQGFEIVPIVAGESEKPTRSVPTATLASLWISVGFYTLLQFAVSSRAPYAEPQSAIQKVAENLWGPLGGQLLQVSLLVSVLGLLAARVLVAPRYLSPLSEDGLTPSVFSRLDARRRGPVFALAATLAVAISVVLFMDVRQFMELSALAIGLQYLAACASLVKLTWDERRISYLGIVSAGISLLLVSQASRSSWSILLVIVLLGQVSYWLWRSLGPIEASRKVTP